MADAVGEPPLYDVFVSYRWVEPDRSWVRDHLVPALQDAGLKVLLDVEDFIPGRDVILEMTRANQQSRCALCIISDAYFDGPRMVHFESLMARRLDATGESSRLVPFVFRPTSTQQPEWMRGLIPVDWTDERGRQREWRKLLRLLSAPRPATPPPPGHDAPPASRHPSRPAIFVHDHLLPSRFVARQAELDRLRSALLNGAENADPVRILTLTAIGGVGKSSLCRHLIDDLEVLATYDPVVWFSFYEARSAGERYLFDELLKAFDWKNDSEPREGAQEVARLRRILGMHLERARALLIFDGFEVAQITRDPDDPSYGAIKPVYAEVDRLLRHLLNTGKSTCLVTSRVGLRQLENTRGYRQVELDLFSPEDGATLLRALGVQGSESDLRTASTAFGGHALTLVAAGRYMVRRKIRASRFDELTGDPTVFQRSPEGERVKKIVDWHRSEITTDQQYFLTRLSLHQEAVTVENFPVLVAGFPQRMSAREVMNDIVAPLVDRGLVDDLETDPAHVRLTAHPLMKLAFSTWLEPDEKKRAHEEWARAAEREPGLFLDVNRASFDEIRPYVEAVRQYLAADNWRDAWKIMKDRVGSRLGRLGYYELVLDLARKVERKATDADGWTQLDAALLLDLMSWSLNRLGRIEEELAHRERQLLVARAGRLYVLGEVEQLVVASFVQAGKVREAEAIGCASEAASARIAIARGDYDQAIPVLERSLSQETGHGRASKLQVLAGALTRSGNFGRAREILAEALAIAEENDFSCCLGSIFSLYSRVALREGNLREARSWWDRRNALFRKLELEEESDAWLLAEEGDYQGALEAAERGASNTVASRTATGLGRVRGLLGLGRIDEASREMAAVVALAAANDYWERRDELDFLREKIASLSTAPNGHS